MVKWAKRRPARAALGAVSGTAIVSVVVLVLLYNVRLQRERDATDARRREAVANLRKARDAVDRLLTRVSEEDLLNVPRMTTVRRKLLEDALEFYRDLSAGAANDPELRYETGRAQRRVAILSDSLGNREQAEQHFREGIAILEKLNAEFPSVPSYRQELAKGYQNLGFSSLVFLLINSGGLLLRFKGCYSGPAIWKKISSPSTPMNRLIERTWPTPRTILVCSSSN
jgi:hypothetical protein